MAHTQLDGAALTDWTAFHALSKAAFGFPDFYGNNLDAWIDCLSYLRDDDAMSSFRLQPDEVLTIDHCTPNYCASRRRKFWRNWNFASPPSTNATPTTAKNRRWNWFYIKQL